MYDVMLCYERDDVGDGCDVEIEIERTLILSRRAGASSSRNEEGGCDTRLGSGFREGELECTRNWREGLEWTSVLGGFLF